MILLFFKVGVIVMSNFGFGVKLGYLPNKLKSVGNIFKLKNVGKVI